MTNITEQIRFETEASTGLETTYIGGIALQNVSVDELAAMSQHEAINTLKQEAAMESEKAGELVQLGTLREIVPSNKAEWTGSISVKKRIESGEISRRNIDEFIDLLASSYVNTVRGARIRCIDGRLRAGYDDTKVEDFTEKLGPQIPGGTIGMAIAHRLTIGESLEDFEDAVIADDIKTTSEKNKSSGYLPGDHSDEHATIGKMGCGAVDGAEPSQEKINPNNIRVIQGLLKGLLGEMYNPQHFNQLVTNSTYILAAEDYYQDIETIIEELKQHNEDGLEPLVGTHNEVVVSINMVEGTTLHRDHLATKTNGKMQAFNYDAWYTIAVSKELYPDSPRLQSQYVHARVGMALATLMHLTDGSIDVLIRQPSQIKQELLAVA